MRIIDLNTYCLLEIFKYLSENDLISLSEAINYFGRIIEQHVFYSRSKDLLLCGHRNNPCAGNRTPKQLTNLERIQVSRNWVKGIYEERQFFPRPRMFACTMSLDSESLYITEGMHLRRYLRRGPHSLQQYYVEKIGTGMLSDISDFVRKQNTIFAGRVNGTCFVTHDRGVYEQSMHQPNEYLFCVDFLNNVYATSTDSSCKIWKRSNEFDLTNFNLFMNLQQSFKTIKLSEDGQWLFGGLYNDDDRQALRSIHLESGEQLKHRSRTLSIYDLKIKDENILFTANFDTTFRIFDRRIDNDVSTWEDPFDSSLYCLEYDGLYGVLCGTNRHGRVNLYDIRMPRKYIQMYFTGGRNYKSTPVHSLVCDSQYMFVAADHNLRQFDFKSNRNGNDYSYINERQCLRYRADRI